MRQEFANKLGSGAWLISGDEKASVKMVVFSDFQCPYCKRFSSVLNELTGEERAQVQVIYRQLPLNIHSWARDAAALTICVALEDKSVFWKLHDFIFAHQEEISKETLQGKVMDFITHETSINAKAVAACLDQKSFEDRLHRDEQLAMELGVTSTPSVFLNGRRISVQSVEDLRNALRTAQLENTVMNGQGPMPVETASVYSATKAAVDAVTVSLSKELGPKKIRVNSLNPGMVDTEGLHSVGIAESDFRKTVESNTPLGRIAQPEDIARAAVFFASDDAGWVTGQTLIVAGGQRQ
jgi:protein-disulfide isomerase